MSVLTSQYGCGTTTNAQTPIGGRTVAPTGCAEFQRRASAPVHSHPGGLCFGVAMRAVHSSVRSAAPTQPRSDTVAMRAISRVTG